MDSAGHPAYESLGEFLVAGVLGQGGSGIVYDASWGPRRVALKVLHPHLADSERVREQFLAEAKRLQAIAHPSVVKVLAVGELPDRRPYLAMERLDGETLASVLARGPLSLAQAMSIFGELAAAVAALHDQGLVHRDLKPENVFVVADEHAVLLDFGIAKALEAPASTTTIDGGVRGTPAYMAPERFFGQPAGVATDIYELAVTLYAMLAARLPWDDLADPEVRLSPRPLVEVAQVPVELDVAIRRALSTRAQNRPTTATALLEAVRLAAGALESGVQPSETAKMFGSAALAPTVTAEKRPWFAERQATTDRGKTPLAWAPAPLPAEAPQQPAPARTRRRWPFVVGAIAVAGAAAALAYWRLSDSDPEPIAAAIAPAPPDAAMLATKDDPWASGHPTQATSQTPRETPKDNDPWSGPREPVTQPEIKAFVAMPAQGPEVPPELARKEIAAAIGHVPADTQVLFSASVGELRHDDHFKVILDRLSKHPRVGELVTLMPCVGSIAAGAEWLVFAAKSLHEGNHATLIVRGRWKRTDVEKCFGHDIEELSMTDGSKVLQLRRLGWIDFIDDHTVYLSVREDLAAAQVHDLAKLGHGPTPGTKKLLGKLPAKRTITAVVDGANDFEWPQDRLPQGSDATAWILVGDTTSLDVAIETHDVAAANKLVADTKPQFDELFKDASPELVGKIDVVREKTTFHIRGALTGFMMGMIVALLPA